MEWIEAKKNVNKEVNTSFKKIIGKIAFGAAFLMFIVVGLRMWMFPFKKSNIKGFNKRLSKLTF